MASCLLVRHTVTQLSARHPAFCGTTHTLHPRQHVDHRCMYAATHYSEAKAQKKPGWSERLVEPVPPLIPPPLALYPTWLSYHVLLYSRSIFPILEAIQLLSG